MSEGIVGMAGAVEGHIPRKTDPKSGEPTISVGVAARLLGIGRDAMADWLRLMPDYAVVVRSPLRTTTRVKESDLPAIRQAIEDRVAMRVSLRPARHAAKALPPQGCIGVPEAAMALGVSAQALRERLQRAHGAIGSYHVLPSGRIRWWLSETDIAKLAETGRGIAKR